MTGSNGERTSPVIRGALIMGKLLHDKPNPPPPNVPELDKASDTPKTSREMVEQHQARTVCASCQKKMDVIGFGLENFDTIGRWRDTEKVGNQQVPIEPERFHNSLSCDQLIALHLGSETVVEDLYVRTKGSNREH